MVENGQVIPYSNIINILDRFKITSQKERAYMNFRENVKAILNYEKYDKMPVVSFGYS